MNRRFPPILAVGFLSASWLLVLWNDSRHAKIAGLAANAPNAVAVAHDVFPTELAKGDVPDFWRSPPIGFETQLATGSVRSWMREVLQPELDRLPARFRQESAFRVVLSWRLSFSGVEGSGTFSPSAIFLAAESPHGQAVTADWLRGALYQELAGQTLNKHRSRFPRTDWDQLNDSALQYGNGSVNAIKRNQCSKTYDPQLMERGFVSEYAQSEFLKDVCCVTELVMADTEQARRFAQRHDRIRGKIEILSQFFVGLDPEFAPLFDRVLSKQPSDAGGASLPP